MDGAIESIRQIRDIQGAQTMDDYMQGLYNGIELALANLEKREPNFISAPEGGWPKVEWSEIHEKAVASVSAREDNEVCLLSAPYDRKEMI